MLQRYVDHSETLGPPPLKLGFLAQNGKSNLRVKLNPEPKSDHHIRTVAYRSFYNVRQLVKVKLILPERHFKTVMCAFLTIWLDYCNIFFFLSGESFFAWIWKVKRAAGQLLTVTHKQEFYLYSTHFRIHSKNKIKWNKKLLLNRLFGLDSTFLSCLHPHTISQIRSPAVLKGPWNEAQSGAQRGTWFCSGSSWFVKQPGCFLNTHSWCCDFHW